MELEVILTFLGASVLLSLMPGPDNIFVLTESLTKGQKNGIGISIGLSLGVLIHTLAAATGLSLIIQNSAFVFSLIKYSGAAYLFYLAFFSMKEKQPDIDFEATAAKEAINIFPLVKKGFLMNVLNPKVSLFFIAFLPQFVNKTASVDITLQMIFLGLIFMVQALIVFGLIAVLSGQLSRYINSPKFWNITKWSKATILSILGFTLIFTEK